MKRILLFMLIANIALMAEPVVWGGGGVDQSKVDQSNQSKSGWFLGAGFGLVKHNIDILDNVSAHTFLPRWTQLSGTFVAKLGGYHYFNPSTRMGLRYYYSFDISAPSYNFRNAASANQRYFYPFLIHLINLDMTVLLFEVSNNKFDFILGGGIGLGWSPGFIDSRKIYKDLATPSDRSGHQQVAMSFEGAVNMGFRWMQEKYGIELMTKIPITSPTIFRNPHYFSRQRTNAFIKSPFNLTLNFTAEL